MWVIWWFGVNFAGGGDSGQCASIWWFGVNSICWFWCDSSIGFVLFNTSIGEFKSIWWFGVKLAGKLPKLPPTYCRQTT